MTVHKKAVESTFYRLKSYLFHFSILPVVTARLYQISSWGFDLLSFHDQTRNSFYANKKEPRVRTRFPLAAHGKPQLNTCFFEILIYTPYILTSRFLSNSKPKNAHSMGKKTSLFHTKTFFNDYFLMQAICVNLLLYYII